MLTDKLGRDVRFRLEMPRIYPSDAVASGMGKCITRWRAQEWRCVFNIHEEVDVEQNMHVSGVGPRNVASYD